eukprot:CAMPEP_0184647878 /NCGR_PEP_ID=MMETSP0308-20130426/4903_1 /TAXON_ID=38269 /ORGANISM="Gloeochaete witrockiana, Strain SAG 46.84" /LENGTH=299 /DNA_ID=CAMNT_0027079253 /DNA_START=238 /DNA_END=1137 /DNA_ORIENTATION=+
MPNREPLQIYGPVGLRAFLRATLRLSSSRLMTSYCVHEILPRRPDPDAIDSHVASDSLKIDVPHSDEAPGIDLSVSADGCWTLLKSDRVTVVAGELRHRVTCYGFVVKEADSPGKLDAPKCKQLGVPPGPAYAALKRGEDWTLPNGEIVRSADVVGPPLMGRKVVILGDTCDSSGIAQAAMDADVLVHESTHADDLMRLAVEYGHSTPSMAGAFAKSTRSHNLVLFHFSTRYGTGALKEKDALPNAACSDAEGPQEGQGSGDIDELVRQAKVAFGSDRVVAAYDLMVFAVPRLNPIASV